jgi:hypothetical protein
VETGKFTASVVHSGAKFSTDGNILMSRWFATGINGPVANLPPVSTPHLKFLKLRVSLLWLTSVL